MGRGVTFGCRAGDPIDKSRVEKIFTITDAGMAGRFQELIANIPMEHMLLSERVISYAQTYLGKSLNDSIYVTLPDHISMAITRYKEGIILSNPLLWDIRRFYRSEFTVGRRACETVEQATGIHFLDDEAAFIAMHFVNAELGSEMSGVYNITYIMQEICTAVKDYFHLEFNEDSLDYYRFITHLRFLAQRLLSGVCYTDEDPELFRSITHKHRNAFACTKSICAFLEQKYHYSLGNEEMLYLTLHIARLVKNSKT